MQGIPAQHTDWVVEHNPLLPLVAGPPQLWDIYLIPSEITVDFGNITALSSQEKAELQHLRSPLKFITKAEWPKNLASLQGSILDYLKALPASTGTFLRFPWKHHMDNMSAEAERFYLTFDLAYMYLHDMSGVRKEKLKLAIGYFKNAAQLNIADMVQMAMNMSYFAWILYIHLELEERIQNVGKRMEPKSLNRVISTCYFNLADKWRDLEKRGSGSSTESTHPFWKGIVQFATNMAVFCSALSEYYTCRYTLLDPSEGVNTYYPTFATNVNMYRGLLLSRLTGHVQLLESKVIKPDILDKLSILSKYDELLIQLYKMHTTLLETCFKPLISKMFEYNQMVSHDPIPGFNDVAFKGDSKALPVTEYEQFQAIVYPIRAAVTTVATVGTTTSDTAPNILKSVVQKFNETFNPNMNATNSLIQSELDQVDLVFATESVWIKTKMDLMDAVKYRQANATRIPPHHRAVCEEYERTMLYLLHTTTQMPRTLFIFLQSTIQGETIPYYESL